tara:strand:- start:3118 stop:3288 length:171 start_codon:yes stop_codon:yes gene_type:complete
MIDTKKKCFKMFDGAALHTIQKMSTPDMEELIEILAKEISARNEEKRFGQMMADVA